MIDMAGRGEARVVVANRAQLSWDLINPAGWLAPDHRYFKLTGADGNTYLVRHDERSDFWELTMFRSEHRRG